MTREQLEHILRAAGSIADDTDIIVIGSQSILGSLPNAPAQLLVSVEADIYPMHRPERWDVIDGTIGEDSPFHSTFGYYAQGVSETTATLPAGWKDRLVAVRNENTRGVTGWCLEPHDLVIAKYVANRPKDRDFVRVLWQHDLVDKSILSERLRATTIDHAIAERIAACIATDSLAKV